MFLGLQYQLEATSSSTYDQIHVGSRRRKHTSVVIILCAFAHEGCDRNHFARRLAARRQCVPRSRIQPLAMSSAICTLSPVRLPQDELQMRIVREDNHHLRFKQFCFDSTAGVRAKYTAGPSRFHYIYKGCVSTIFSPQQQHNSEPHLNSVTTP